MASPCASGKQGGFKGWWGDKGGVGCGRWGVRATDRRRASAFFVVLLFHGNAVPRYLGFPGVPDAERPQPCVRVPGAEGGCVRARAHAPRCEHGVAPPARTASAAVLMRRRDLFSLLQQERKVFVFLSQENACGGRSCGTSSPPARPAWQSVPPPVERGGLPSHPLLQVGKTLAHTRTHTGWWWCAPRGIGHALSLPLASSTHQPRSPGGPRPGMRTGSREPWPGRPRTAAWLSWSVSGVVCA